MAKYRMTGCARLFLFLLILIPIAYFAASYITGDDPIATLKDLIGSDDKSMELNTENSGKNKLENSELIDLKDAIRKQEETIEEKTSRIDNLEKEIDDLKKQIENLQQGEAESSETNTTDN